MTCRRRYVLTLKDDKPLVVCKRCYKRYVRERGVEQFRKLTGFHITEVDYE